MQPVRGGEGQELSAATVTFCLIVHRGAGERGVRGKMLEAQPVLNVRHYASQGIARTQLQQVINCSVQLAACFYGNPECLRGWAFRVLFRPPITFISGA